MDNKSIQNLKKIKGATGKSREKSKSKQIGVKSTFVMENKVAISSFAKAKNENGDLVSNVEIISSDDGSEIYRQTFKLLKDAEIDSDFVKIEGLFGSTEFENPVKALIRGDYICIKGALEIKYFGENFPNDNIHVQIAYNIADIKKYITRFINQIIYAFCNINRTIKDNGTDDIIGNTYTFASLENQVFKDDSAKLLLEGVPFFEPYFPGAFKRPKKDKEGKITEEAKKKCDEYNFNILRLLSLIRQFCEHENLKNQNADKYLYDLTTSISNHPELLNTLNISYKTVIDRINKDFEVSENSKSKSTAGNNLFILSQILPQESTYSLVEKYYRYTVYKSQNNLGVNLKLLREIIIESNLKNLRDKRYDTYRSKINTILGFIINDFLKDSELTEQAVSKLRANDSEDGRLEIYCELAQKTWQNIGRTLSKAVCEIEREAKNKFKSNFKTDFSVVLQPYCLNNNQGDYFTKMINLMTKFLDGKEINELLTGLISRFKNIEDLSSTAKECGIAIKYISPYCIFSKAGEIADELSLVKSVARMKPELSSIKNNVILDAAEILGVTDVVANSLTLDKDEKGYAAGSKFLERIYTKDKNGRLNSQLRNFIINNVVKSRWFFYIVRYTKPEACRKLVSNEKIVQLVLSEIPDEQIARYYKAVTASNTTDSADARRYLAKRLHNFSIDKIFDEIEGIDRREYASQQEGTTKQKNQAIIGLYLTVAYLFIKNIVKINAVFSIAFSCLERDMALFERDKNSYLSITRRIISKDSEKIEEYNKIRDSIRDNAALTVEEKRKEYKVLKSITAQMHNTLHGYYYVSANLKNATMLNESVSNILIKYRNIVAHLNVPIKMVDYLPDVKNSSSYYAIYVYCLQRWLLEQCNACANQTKNDFLNKQIEFINTHGSYSADLLWVLNTPFAYNMARYKNLSIEDLFLGKPVKKKESMPSISVESNKKKEPNKLASVQSAYNLGDVVEMNRIELTQRGGIRGYAKNTDIKLNISPKIVSAAGIIRKGITPKILKVKIISWDNGAGAYNTATVGFDVPEQSSNYQFKVGDVVTIIGVERTSNGKIRGIIQGTQIKATISKTELSGKNVLEMVGKPISVELLRWDANACSYNARIKD